MRAALQLIRQAPAEAHDRLAGTFERRTLTLLALVLVLDYADRTLLGALGPTLKSVFDLSDFDLGLLAAAFAIIGAGASIPIGTLTDRFNRTTMIALSLVLWCVALVFVGAAVSFAMLFTARLFLGAVSATYGPATPSLVGDVVPASGRGEALGYITSGQLAGGGIGLLLPVVVTAFISWRWTFWLLAIGGAVVAFAFWRAGEPARTASTGPAKQPAPGSAQIHEPPAGTPPVPQREQQIVEDARITPSARAILTRPPAELSYWDAVLYVIRVRTDLIVLVARSIGDFFFQGIATFAVVFATGWYGISQSEADLAILVVGVGALVGVLGIGRLADESLRRGSLNSRLWIGSLGYIMATFAAYPAFITHSLPIALAFFALAAFFLAGAGPALDAVRIDVLVPEMRGRAEAIRQVLRTVSEGGAPVAIGLLAGALASESADGLQQAFLITLPLLALTGVIMLVALRTYQPDIAAAAKSDQILARRQSGKLDAP